MSARCPLPIGEKRSTMRVLRLVVRRSPQSSNFSLGKSGVRCSNGTRSLTSDGSRPLILSMLVSGKYFLQSGLRVLELLVKMDIVYEDKDKIILNKPVAGDGKYGGNMAAQAAERIKGIRIKRGCIALCAVSLKVDGKLYEVKPGFYFCIYVSNELISALAREFGHCCNDLFLSELVIYKHKSCKCRFIISFCFFD